MAAAILPAASSGTLTLASVHDRRLEHAHQDLVHAAIERYRCQAKQMLKLARAAALGGNGPLSLGYLDLATTYRAMAQGLAEQTNSTSGESQ
jgi:hypothetical protein